jgi:hypothetical protein
VSLVHPVYLGHPRDCHMNKHTLES